jgi:hypothetical protein
MSKSHSQKHSLKDVKTFFSIKSLIGQQVNRQESEVLWVNH